MLNKYILPNIFSLIAIYCSIRHVNAVPVVKNGKGNICVANRMRALQNATIPYNKEISCEIEKTFISCISSLPKPSSSLNIIQHLLSCTRLQLMKEYKFCQLDNNVCDFPKELTELSENEKFDFPEIKVQDFGEIHLEGCLNLFTYLQRYSIHPCTETAISALCMKPLIRGLGLFDSKSNDKYFSSLHEEFTCDCAEVAKNLCADPQLCPNDVFNLNWKSFQQKNNDAELFHIDKYSQCASLKASNSTEIEKCLKMDFKTVGKCLQKRYLSYSGMSFGNTKLPFEKHCDIENDLYNCVSETSDTENDFSCANKNYFIIWVRIQSFITMKILQISKMCSKPYNTVSLDEILTNKLPDNIKLALKNKIGIIDNKLTTQCSRNAIDSCYYVRGYMHDFLVHPCIEWMMFYRCVRDNLIVCGEPDAADFITNFLEGQTQISINKGNHWNHNECAILNKMNYHAKTDEIITMNIINPFKKSIDDDVSASS